jgi:hypothetical protein
LATSTATLQFAILAFKNVPVWAAVAHIAIPLYKCGVCFNELKMMGAIGWQCHDEGVEQGLRSFSKKNISEQYGNL